MMQQHNIKQNKKTQFRLSAVTQFMSYNIICRNSFMMQQHNIKQNKKTQFRLSAVTQFMSYMKIKSINIRMQYHNKQNQNVKSKLNCKIQFMETKN
jgi:hypothetical protein